MDTEALLETMKRYALAERIPIIEDESIAWVREFLRDKQATNILEIGGAIGYSTIYLQQFGAGRVLSVEKDAARYEQGDLFLQQYAEADAIMFVHGDAKSEEFLHMVANNGPYDVLFIDAAKRYNQFFFERFAPFVRPGGYILTDNLNLRGLADADTADIAALPRRKRPMVRALLAYKAWLGEQPEFSTTFVATGDGLAISQKIK